MSVNIYYENNGTNNNEPLRISTLSGLKEATGIKAEMKEINRLRKELENCREEYLSGSIVPFYTNREWVCFTNKKCPSSLPIQINMREHYGMIAITVTKEVTTYEVEEHYRVPVTKTVREPAYLKIDLNDTARAATTDKAIESTAADDFLEFLTKAKDNSEVDAIMKEAEAIWADPNNEFHEALVEKKVTIKALASLQSLLLSGNVSLK